MISCAFEDGGKGHLRHLVIDALLLKDGKILLVKRAKNLVQCGKWGLTGGFVERDETAQGALKREVLEETGYEIKSFKFFTIIDSPKRLNDERQNVALVYVCQAGEKVGGPDKESTEQRWFYLDALPLKEEMAFDHFQIINLFLKNKDNNFPKLFNY